jgi:hypothetical protein
MGASWIQKFNRSFKPILGLKPPASGIDRRNARRSNAGTIDAILTIARTAPCDFATPIARLGFEPLGRGQSGTLLLLRRGLPQLLQLVPQFVNQGIFVLIGQVFEVR